MTYASIEHWQYQHPLKTSVNMFVWTTKYKHFLGSAHTVL